MADAEYFKLDDGTVLAVADATARQKVGSAELQTTAKDCSGAINELKQSLDVLSGIFEFNPTAYSGDMNDIKNPSCYFVTSSASNRPASGFWRLITLTFASAPTQIAISNDLTSMYLRNFTNGAWTAWSKFY